MTDKKGTRLDQVATGKHHFSALDGLRGGAALWVVVGHVSQNIAGFGGFHSGIAVDLFIMISGFLMYALHSSDAWNKPQSFAVKRIFRLLPLYWLVLSVSFLTLPWFSMFLDVVRHGKPSWLLDGGVGNFLIHLTLLHGLIPTLAQSTSIPDWSLSLEAQFYLIFPLLALGFRVLGTFKTIAATLVLQIISLTVFPEFFQSYPVFYAALPLKMHIFAAGMLIACAFSDARFRSRYLAMAILCAVLPIKSAPYEVLALRGCVAILLALAILPSRYDPIVKLKALSSSSLAEFFGRVSYSVYLIHLPIVYGVLFWLGSYSIDHRLRFVIALAIVLPVTYFTSWLSYEHIEKRGIALGRRVLARSVRSRQPTPLDDATNCGRLHGNDRAPFTE